MNWLLKISFDLLILPLKIIGLLIPKNKKVWVFGCSSGDYYKDNSKYLFEFMSRITGYKAIWLTKNKGIYKKLNNQGKNCFYFYSLQGIFYSLIAKYIFISYSYDDVGFFCYLFPQRTKIVQLYHGTPLKRLEIEKNRSILNKITKFILLSYLGRKFDFMFNTSDIATEKLNEFFKENMEKYIISGYPRNDGLFHNSDSSFLNKLKEKIIFEKIVFYLPTYREYSNDKNFNLFNKFGFNEDKLNKILEDNNAIFLIKLHPNDYTRAQYIFKKISNNSRVIVINDDEIESDIYPILNQTNILITDYSSVYIDFLLLDRPIIFSAFDRKEYEGLDRGFYFNYDEITPGLKANNWGDLCVFLEDIFKGDNFKNERIKISNYFNKYNDGMACERIFNYLKDK